MFLIGEMVANGTDDWVPAREVYSLAARSGITDPAVLRALAVGLIAEALVRGLMVAGDVSEKGFEAWDMTLGDTIGRIATDWFARAEPMVGVGEVVWLNNTAVGEQIGEEVIQREANGADAG